jgi:hypothetical protein
MDVLSFVMCVVNFQLYGEFERAGIDFAYPTQALYVSKVQ